MVHVQGSLAVAEALKRERPDLPVVFGGISSTYYARELIDYPFIDFVMRGYDTHEPLEKLVRALRRDVGAPSIAEVPNLVWKTPDGEPRENDFSHKPDTFGCGVDWSDLARSEPTRTLPILELLSTQNAGCAYDCGWCGGSREAFRRVFGKQRAMARKPLFEAFDQLGAQALATMVDDWFAPEPQATLRALVARLKTRGAEAGPPPEPVVTSSKKPSA